MKQIQLFALNHCMTQYSSQAITLFNNIITVVLSNSIIQSPIITNSISVLTRSSPAPSHQLSPPHPRDFLLLWELLGDQDVRRLTDVHRLREGGRGGVGGVRRRERGDERHKFIHNWQLDYVALLGVLWVVSLNGIYTTILTTSHNKLYYHGNFLKLIGTSISTLRGHLTTLSLMLVLWVGEKCLHHWPTFTQCSYTNGSIKKIYIIATNYRR